MSGRFPKVRYAWLAARELKAINYEQDVSEIEAIFLYYSPDEP